MNFDFRCKIELEANATQSQYFLTLNFNQQYLITVSCVKLTVLLQSAVYTCDTGLHVGDVYYKKHEMASKIRNKPQFVAYFQCHNFAPLNPNYFKLYKSTNH